jgi:hypothetical protein
MDRAYDVRLGEFPADWEESLLAASRSEEFPDLGANWEFGIESTGDHVYRPDTQNACYSVGARYAPPPAGVTVTEGQSGAGEQDHLYRLAADIRDAARVEFRGCSARVSVALFTPIGRDRVEDARKSDTAERQPVVRICLAVGSQIDPGTQEEAACTALRDELGGRLCILRTAELTPRD